MLLDKVLMLVFIKKKSWHNSRLGIFNCGNQLDIQLCFCLNSSAELVTVKFKSDPCTQHLLACEVNLSLASKTNAVVD